MRNAALTRPARSRRALAGTAALAATALVAGVAYGATPAAAGGVPKDYAGPSWTAAVTNPTAEKQQSKLWRAGNAWWAVMVSATKGQPTIHELRADNTWRDTGTVVDSRADSTADVQFSGTTLYVVSRTLTGAITYSRFTYNTTARSYARVTGFPVNVATGGTESASLARDSTGKVWATWTQAGNVYVSRSFSVTDDKKWIAPRVVPGPDSIVSGDDVATIVAWDGKIGILWSDQQSDVFRFASHLDSASAASGWSFETPIPSVDGLADDHISLKAIGGDKRLFAVVKTSFDTTGATADSPQVYALRRNANGTWVKAKAASLGDKLTRPQLALDRTNSRMYFLATGPQSGGTIYYKSSPFVGMKFARGRGAPLIANSGSVMNDVTTLKASLAQADGLVALAADTANKRYYHARLSLAPADGQPPITQNTITSTLSGTEITTTWPLATDDRFVVAYDVYVDSTSTSKQLVETIDATTSANEDLRTFTVTHSPGPGTWKYSIIARDLAGNTSDEESGIYVTVP